MSNPKLLQNFWTRICRPEQAAQLSSTWNQELEALYANNRGMEESLKYLYDKRPSVNDFLQWVSQLNPEAERDEEITGDTLSEDEIRFFNENGYVVIKQAITETDCEEARKAIWQFLEMDPRDSYTWKKPHSGKKGLMLALVHHPALDKNRNSAKIRRAYEQLYQSKAIYKTIDKTGFNPPVSIAGNTSGTSLHWDVSLKQPIRFALQGLLYLTHCDETQGAFSCVPGFHHRLQEWLTQFPPGFDVRSALPTLLQGQAVAGRAGDFIIWHQALPHGATPNYGNTPRLVQYLTYKPIGYTEEKEWI